MNIDVLVYYLTENHLKHLMYVNNNIGIEEYLIMCSKSLVFVNIRLYFYRTYLWFDEKGKKTRVAAPQYIDYVMTFIQKTISDETIFPTKYGK